MKNTLLLYVAHSLAIAMLGGFEVQAQNIKLIDSLQLQLKNHNDSRIGSGKSTNAMYDTTAVNILYKLSEAYWGNNPDKAMDYANQTLALSEQIGYKKGEGNAYNSMAVINRQKGDYLQAIELNKKSLKIRLEINDKKGIAGSYSGIGIVYQNQGKYPEALNNYLVALKIREKINDKKGIANSYTNLGVIYTKLNNYPESLKCYGVALKILKEEDDDKLGIARCYSNIGMVFSIQGNNTEAFKNFLDALKIQKEIGDKKGISASYNSIGTTYFAQGNYPDALKYFFSALKILEEIGDKSSIVSYQNIGTVFIEQKKFNDAARYLNKSLTLSKEIGDLQWISDSYEYLTILDSTQANFKQAFEHSKLFIAYRDSMFNEENTKKLVQAQMQYDFDKKEALTRTEQEKKDVIALKEKQKQKIIKNGFVGGFSVVLIFAGVFFTQRNKIKKGKKLSDELLLNILPSEVAEELKRNGSAAAKQFDDVTVMFTDFKNFTQITEKLSPAELVAEIHFCFKEFDNIITKYKIEKIKTIGDSYMCAGGLPVANKTNPSDVVNAGLEIQQFIREHLTQRMNEGKEPFDIRIGIHTGPVVAGIVGIKKFAYDIWGDTVNIASRMQSSGEASKVNISGVTFELVKNEFNCTYRGKIQAKNKGEIDMYFVESIL